jgi:hypothetical protein
MSDLEQLRKLLNRIQFTEEQLPPCRYGPKCYRINPDHFKRYSHHAAPFAKQSPPSAMDSSEEDAESDSAASAHNVGHHRFCTSRHASRKSSKKSAKGSKPLCKYGANCGRTNPDHNRDYKHPPHCVDDPNCSNSNPLHRGQFRHMQEVKQEMVRERRKSLSHSPAPRRKSLSHSSAPQRKSLAPPQAGFKQMCPFGPKCALKGDPSHDKYLLHEQIVFEQPLCVEFFE